MLDDYQDLIDELLQTPSLFREWLNSNPSDEMIALVMVLRDRDREVLERMRRLVRETSPHFKALPDIDDHPTGAALEPVPELIDSFDNARGDLVSLLMNLSLKDWERTATHDNGGTVSLADEVESHVETDEALVARIRALSE